MALSAGVRLGPYEIAKLLGAGGMGEVYRARDSRLQRDVAVKVLSGSLSDDPQRLQRFEREARATAALNHPHILAVYDIGIHEGTPYIVSELLEGSTLREQLTGGPLTQRKAVEYALQIARGLSAAHEKGIVHRDLKPENVFETKDGVVKILDFGLAKLVQREAEVKEDAPTMSMKTQEGQILGTAGYISPEQVRGQQTDARSDLFAFGCILYEMLSGKRAFRGETTMDALSAILNQEPPELTATGRQVAPALERIIRHCLEKNADQRFQSARDVAFSLETLSTISMTTEASQIPVPARRARRRWLVSMLASVLVLCTFAVGYWIAMHSTDRPPPDFHRLTYRRGFVREARFMPDGQNILYTAVWDGGTPKIYSTRFDSTDSSELPLDNAEVLSISARGELALLTKVAAGNLLSTGTLSTAPSTASAPREVETNVSFADWSPDGSELALIRNNSVLEYPRGNIIYRAEAVEGLLRNVRVAPKGDLLAVIDYAGADDGRVVILDRKGNKKAQSPFYGAVLGCAWSPDSSEIWYSANGGPNRVIYGMSLTGKIRLVLRVPGVLHLKDVSRQGRVLLCRDDPSASTMFMGRGEKAERNLSWYNQSTLGDLSADGKTVLFIDGGAATEEKWGEYIRRTDGSPAVRLGDYLFGKLSPDGNWVLAINQYEENKPDMLYLLPTGAGQVRRFEPGKLFILSTPRWGWLPDGNSFFFAAREEGRKRRTYIQRLSGGAPIPITPEGVVGTLATPDGKYLITRDSPTTGVLYPIGEGTQVKIQGFLPGESIVRWHADGRRLLVLRRNGNGWEVSLLEPYSGKREVWRQLSLSVDRTGLTTLGHLTLSADGECYAYYVTRLLSELYVVNGLR